MKHRQTHRRGATEFLTLSGLVLGLVLAHQFEPRRALAGDDKIFAPHSCLPRETPDDDIGDARFLVNAIERTLADDQAFICPLMRDVVQGSLDAVWVRVGNDSLSDATAPGCCVYSFSPVGTDEDFDCMDADGDEGRQTLAFDLDDFEEVDYGYYVLSCWLGLGDSIYSIRTSESD